MQYEASPALISISPSSGKPRVLLLMDDTDVTFQWEEINCKSLSRDLMIANSVTRIVINMLVTCHVLKEKDGWNSS